MRKRGLSKSTLILDTLIIVVLISAVGYFIYSSFLGDNALGIRTPAETIEEQTPEEVIDEQPSEEEIEEEEEARRFWGEWGSGPSGGGGAGSTPAGGAPSGGTGDTGTTNETPPEEPEPPEEEETPTATLSLLDFDYEIIDYDTAKVTSLSYSAVNSNVGSVTLELLIYIYDENDDASKKGLVRDQIHLGELGYGESVTDTVAVSAYYTGDLATEKILKLTLIGYMGGESFNLGSVTQDVLFV
ncbi:hypothetical protein KY360_06485 [Candidatus Woesearchaeota archaeon]|nr:hypothetical protein [Candidatus Woesearchaeota archaeon]